MRPNRINGRTNILNEPMPDEPRDSAKSYTVEINQVDNGFVVNVGCKTLIFVDLECLIDAIEIYYTDFEKAKKVYLAYNPGVVG